VNYFGLPEIAGLSAKTAAGFVSFYWGGNDRTVSRRGTSAAVQARILLAVCAIFCGALVTGFHATGRHTAMWTILASASSTHHVPTIFSLGVAELGPLTEMDPAS